MVRMCQTLNNTISSTQVYKYSSNPDEHQLLWTYKLQSGYEICENKNKFIFITSFPFEEHFSCGLTFSLAHIPSFSKPY